MLGKLILEDGAIFTGKMRGYDQSSEVAEIVFNTGMVGYQEVITDPSYTGQIVTMTYPLQGNYGVNEKEQESNGPKVKGFIVKELCDSPSNWQAEMDLEQYLQENKIVCLADVDTRALTRHLRDKGTMKGMIIPKEQDEVKTLLKIKKTQLNTKVVAQATTKEITRIPGNGPRVVVMDFGIKLNIIRCLMEYGCELIIVPAHTTAEEILELLPDGLFLSNGPGDPQEVPEAIEAIKKMIGILPIFGICLGHQMMGLAQGAKTYKLKFGHRGVNHSVQDIKTKKVLITSQNHGYAIDPKSLPTDLEITHINLNDGTVEGMRHKILPIYSVQFHPEAAPGPVDSKFLFEEFINWMKASSKGGNDNG